ncbi:ABC transporter ATP-binding protein [Nafulsella turpanensis]|uniref:ABC transporter ATP-binding protein n=1 Tax=Nafulsella turpanensis TaxID=1265690 RepID=UPI00034C5547|nr:ABC transporter ATP-binding protein [Nafulsella turpanensis]
MNILEARHIHKSYATHTALRDVSLSIPSQSIFGLLGPNGAGKTTLIRIITQIIERDSGEVFIKGEELNPEHILKIGYLPEERGLYKKMKVGEQLLYLARLKGLSTNEAKQRITHWLKRLDMMEWKGKNIEDLSKGMQQKIQFIATVLHEPELIILDEPFSGFDPVNANLIKDEIMELRRKGSTIIFSTHRMESVEEMCDHIALINRSRKILDGSKQEIRNSYRNNTFIVEHRGSLNGHAADFNLLEQEQLNDDFFRSVIRNREGESPNSLLRDLLGHVEVFHFVEKIPSINEIFISKVQEVVHE